MSDPTPLSAAQFPQFFEALWKYAPFPWQVEFAARLCAGEPPDYVTAPTGSGKTACLDGALFAMAVQAALPPGQRTIGRRVFFIVNRRIIVDEAYERARRLAGELREAFSGASGEGDILRQTASWLQKLAGGAGNVPLARAQLRGGIYRDGAWAQSLIQPMIVCSTIDQAGSRLLFRGYGVSPEARPIHAALLAQDSLLIIDEAHISQPFVETLHRVKQYRAYRPPGSEPVALPFSVVCLTATPPKGQKEGVSVLGLSNADRENLTLAKRLGCKKIARLAVAQKAKGKQWMEELAKELVAQAAALLKQGAPRSVAIMVNRVQTARKVYELVSKNIPSAEVTLLLGRMRPLDRDRVTGDLQDDLKTGLPNQENAPGAALRIVVSTQCLEVGADFDFDALVTECASLDALRQRFGRLNRGGRDIDAQAVICLPQAQEVETPPEKEWLDPVYGNSIPRTFSWLKSGFPDGGVDFGLTAMTAAAETFRAADPEAFSAMLSPVAKAPVLLPAYLDCWAQTNPAPGADPDVSIFLHGPKIQMADVQVCWRADLPDEDDPAAWRDTLSLCPPTTLECLPVPLTHMLKWLRNGGYVTDETGDAPQREEDGEDNRKSIPPALKAMVWTGPKESHFLDDLRSLRPGDTLILRTSSGGWQVLGHLPEAPEETRSSSASRVDCAEVGQAAMRRRAFLRLHPVFWPDWAEDSPIGRMLKWAQDENSDWQLDEVKDALLEAAGIFDSREGKAAAELAVRLKHLAKFYKGGRGTQGLEAESAPHYPGVVLSVRELLPANDDAETASEDGDDNPLLDAAEPQRLVDHTLQVVSLAKASGLALGLDGFSECIAQSAELHDIGKADRRFQALLIGSDVSAALARPELLAKSASIPRSAVARDLARRRASLPREFRHEMLSAQLAESLEAGAHLPADEHRKLLALHLIASHHGHARPFAPLVDDESPPPVSISTQGLTFALSSAQRLGSPAHALDSGVTDRFWQLTRRHGWWGLALLETVLRLADQEASAHPENQS